MSGVSLVGIHPRLIVAVTKILTAMDALGYHMLITDGLRTVEQQQRLYQQGRHLDNGVWVPNDPQRTGIVTNADGLVHRSNHQPHADGFGHAVDCCFVIDGKPSWQDGLPWKLYGEMAKVLGCVWGGDWSSLEDRPHIEWPKEN